MRTYENAAEPASGRIDGIVAPVKGLNTQAPLAGLSSNYAIQLNNWVCQPDALVSRLGCVSHVTGFVNAPKTLMVYSNASGSKMFAASASGIFDVTNAGAVGAAAIAGTSGQGISVNFATSAGQYLIFCNGVDTTKVYDGTTWSASAVTGPATSSLKSVEAYRQRLFFLQNNFLGFYYLGADAIAGAATAFRIGSLARRGGSVTAHATWSVDGGNGPDDHYVLATDKGEIVVFRGSDPAVPANWTFVGVYYVGEPIGPNCFMKYGGELLYLSVNGVTALSALLVSTTRDYSSALSVNIQKTISDAAALYGSLPGWKLHVAPTRNLIMVNAPDGASTSRQFVYNTLARGWSTFSGWNAADFVEFNRETYFTTGTQVAKAFSGFTDFNASIVAICDTSYNRFQTRNQLKPILARAVFAAAADVPYNIGIAQDFSDNYSENVYTGTSANVGKWDSGLWNTSAWGGGFKLNRRWVTIASQGGIALSTRFKVESRDSTTVLLAFDYKFADQGLVF